MSRRSRLASPPRAHRFFSDGELPPPPAESLLSGDADELWQASVEREARANLRFTLAEMFFVTALLAVILTVGRFVRLPLLAGVLGFLVLIGLGNLSHQQRPRWAQIVWLTLILAYAFVAVGAAWNVD